MDVQPFVAGMNLPIEDELALLALLKTRGPTFILR